LCRFLDKTRERVEKNYAFAPKELNIIGEIILKNRAGIMEAWDDHCGTNTGSKIKNIIATKDTIMAQLMDGRTISVPLAWSWR